MNLPGASDVLVQARRALLDALEALREQRDAIVLIGAQAIYLHTGRADIALAEATKDSDLALDTRLLTDDPRIEQAMSAAGFSQDVSSSQPGAWLNPAGIPVDLMVPEALAGAAASQRRGARIPPHANTAARRAVGLEAAVVDHAPMYVTALGEGDERSCTVEVAGPAALLVAKLHKLWSAATTPDDWRTRTRTTSTASSSPYRPTRWPPRCYDCLMTHSPEPSPSKPWRTCARLFAAGPDALGSAMAGRAELGVGEPDTVAASVAVLAGDLLSALDLLSR